MVASHGLTGGRCPLVRGQRAPPTLPAEIFEAVNVYAAGLLALQRQYASWPAWACSTGVWTNWSSGSVAPPERFLPALARMGGRASRQEFLAGCEQPGLPADPGAIRVLQPNRALASNLPFPKTRRIVFLNNKPATLPGWAELSVEG